VPVKRAPLTMPRPAMAQATSAAGMGDAGEAAAMQQRRDQQRPEDSIRRETEAHQAEGRRHRGAHQHREIQRRLHDPDRARRQPRLPGKPVTTTRPAAHRENQTRSVARLRTQRTSQSCPASVASTITWLRPPGVPAKIAVIRFPAMHPG